ncbi:RNA-binding S4 domain-containing protein [Serinibacter arcticus]|uniref:Uncharacterized protein n=1 Tax=Serinibacter arcticus TaxID=1655435 RepID=A0A4Z1E1L7_9MICO|nr:RNA-binding S4 domain-containing protein [Serinibacter arcticus]TGO05845.1 hypothetical protein SERN_0037 [Serinibacter arcticus]
MDIEIRDDIIRLGQLLKLAGLVDDGSDVKDLLSDDAVSVDGEVETRRGRQVPVGAVVEIDLPQGVRTLLVVRQR